MDRIKGLRPEMLLFTAFFATVPFYSPNLTMFQEGFADADMVVDWFVRGALLAAMGSGLAVYGMTSRGRGGWLARYGTMLGGAASSLVSFALFLWALVCRGAWYEVVSFVSGCGASLGCMVLSVGWARLLAAFDLKSALLCVGLMVGAASLVDLLLPSVAVQIGIPVFGLMLTAGAVAPCLAAWRDRSGGCASGEDEGSENAGDQALESLFPERDDGLASFTERMISVAAVPCTGLVVFAFISGVRKFVLFDVVYVDALGTLIGALAAVPLCLVKRDRPAMPFIYRVLLPGVALLLMLLNAFPEGSIPLWTAAWLSYGFYGMVAIVALAVLCAVSHAGEFPAASVCGLAIAAFSTSSLLGIACGAFVPAFSDGGGPALLVVSTLYFVFLVAAALRSGWRAGFDEGGAASSTTGFEERCRRAAEKGGLSPRESEVLGYLGRGYGVVYIAKTLVISESTVRTHVKSIYRKLGVFSREELLQLVDACL